MRRAGRGQCQEILALPSPATMWRAPTAPPTPHVRQHGPGRRLTLQGPQVWNCLQCRTNRSSKEGVSRGVKEGRGDAPTCCCARLCSRVAQVHGQERERRGCSCSAPVGIFQIALPIHACKRRNGLEKQRFLMRLHPLPGRVRLLLGGGGGALHTMGHAPPSRYVSG